MKKFWKIRVDKFFKESLVFLGVDDEYINILMDNIQCSEIVFNNNL